MNKDRLKIYFIFLFVCSCNKSMDPSSYYKWVNNPTNGLILSDSSSLFFFQANYVPSEVTAYQIYQGDNGEMSFKEAKLKTENSIYIHFKFFKKDKTKEFLNDPDSDKKTTFYKIQYLSDEIKNDFYLIYNTDTIDCSNHIFERTYHLTPYTQIILIFDKPKSELTQDLKLIYEDQFLNVGKREFTFKRKDIENAPKLKI